MSDKRPQVIAQKNYLQHRDRLAAMQSLEEQFAYIYEMNLWGAGESRSGLGSTLHETEVLRTELLSVVEGLPISSILDILCGDFRWLSQVALPGNVSYIGADIVAELVTHNQRRFGSSTREFIKLDITADPLPKADLILCRDCLVHLSQANIRRAITNLKRSGAKWIFTTHFLRTEENNDISDGDWRPLSLTRPPFNFPEPELTIIEACHEGGGAYDDKCLALWRIADLP